MTFADEPTEVEYDGEEPAPLTVPTEAPVQTPAVEPAAPELVPA